MTSSDSSEMDQFADVVPPSLVLVSRPQRTSASRRRLSSRAESVLRQGLLEHPTQMLLSLATESLSDRRHIALSWVRLQKQRGSLLQVEPDDDESYLRWIEEHRIGLLREVFEELETLRSYRASADTDIRRAVECINASTSLRFSHH